MKESPASREIACEQAPTWGRGGRRRRTAGSGEPALQWCARAGCPCYELALGFELVEEGDEIGVLLQTVEIGVLLHPIEVAIAEFDGLAEGAQGSGLAFHEGKAAGEIVMRGGVRGEESDEAAVHAQTVDDATMLGVEAAQDLDDVGVGRVAFENRLEEFDFELVVVGAGHGAINCGAGRCR